MEEADELLRRMHSLIHQVRASPAELANFIRAESLPLGEIVSDWLEVSLSSRSNDCRSGRIYISEKETEQLIKQRRVETWIRAKQTLAPLELYILADWQTQEAKALTLSINLVLKTKLKQGRLE